MWGQDREQMRRFFCDVWRKRTAGETLQPLETIIAGVIVQHPEYQMLLQDVERAAKLDFTEQAGATNPFLHMAMHIAIQEQLSAGRPAGIREIYRRLCRRFPDQHTAEHEMMAVLEGMLREAQQTGTMPDEALYLQRLTHLTRSAQ